MYCYLPCYQCFILCLHHCDLIKQKRVPNSLELVCGAYGTLTPYIKPFLNKARERYFQRFKVRVPISVAKLQLFNKTRNKTVQIPDY